MISLVLAIFWRRLLWLPPALAVLALLSVVYAIPGPALSSYAFVALFLAPISVWITVLVGSCDDNGHREMLAAQLGSIRRAHVERALGATALLLATSALCTVVPVLTSSLRRSGEGADPLPSNLTILATGFATHFSFCWVGVAVGTLLHRPLVDRTSVAVLAAIALGLALPFVPPVIYVLRELNRNRAGSVPILLVASVCIAAASMAAAATLADRR